MAEKGFATATDIQKATIHVDGNAPIKQVVGTDPELQDKLADRIEHVEEVLQDAAAASKREVEMGFLEALKLYPRASFFSILFSTAIIMEGFDLTLIGSFYGLPAFQKRFGEEIAPGRYVITADWQTGLSNAVQVGQIAGLMINGWACDRYGYKKTIGASLVVICAFIFITFFANSLPMLLVGEFLCGLPWGVFQTLTTAYAAEIAPAALRPFLTTYVNLCWVMGQFVASGVLKGVSTLDVNNQWAYRLPFALQWVWPIPILIGVFFATESPYFLVRQGRLEEAKAALITLGSEKPGAIPADERVAQIQHTNEMEKAMSAGTSYLDCLRGTNLRRTEIAAVAWMIQTACGSGLIGQSTVFYQEAGLSASDSFSFNLGKSADPFSRFSSLFFPFPALFLPSSSFLPPLFPSKGAIGTISSWASMRRYGRRSLYLWGLEGMFVVLLGVGVTGFFKNTSASWASGSLLIVYSFLYQFTVGPVCYCLVAEIGSTRLRAKTIVLARNAYNIIGIINNVLVPRMLSPIEWNWGPKTAFFFAGANILCIVWCYFRLPETKGRTYGELSVLFDDRVPARKFRTTAVDLFGKGGEPLEKGDSFEPSPAGLH
ncbi:uncharacterized protein JCM6883_003296 [Sporobolomyces salmoneus]|uniref:uncharacterized protein n=1 Tax=Sporobolomyces salmoneus TaxID=183962 RepID=UPI00316D19B8